MTIAIWIVSLGMLYAAIGVLFAVVFSVFGAGRIDPAAKDSTFGFRLLIIPGAAALWPILLKRWLSGASHPPAENNPHRAQTTEVKQ